MGFYSGAKGKAGIVKEATYGAGGTAGTYIGLISETMRPGIDHIRRTRVIGSRFFSGYVHGDRSAGGTIRIEVDPDNIGLLLGCMLGSEATAQVEATTAYDHTYTPLSTAGGDLPSIMLQIDKVGTVCEYPGTKVASGAFSLRKGAIVEAEFTLLSQKEDDDQELDSLTPSTKKPYVFSHGAVSIDDSAVAYVNAMDFTYDNLVDEESGIVLDGNDYRAAVNHAGAILTGTMQCEWNSDSDALRDAILDNTSVDIDLVITSTETIEAGYYYTLSMALPVCHLLGELPVISTRDRLPFPVNFEAMYNSGGEAVTFVHRDARTTSWTA